jgi:hypothetical protein
VNIAPEAGWTVRVASGPLEGTYGVVKAGIRWRWVKIETCDEVEQWVPLARLELVNKGVE